MKIMGDFEFFSIETLLVSIVAVFVVLLILQILFLMKMRKSMFQIGQFMRLMNLIFKEMSNIQSVTISTAKSNQESLKNLNKNPIKTNKKDSCQFCKHRLSFIKMEAEQLSFRYHCGLTKDEVSLQFYCGKFEADVESASRKS